jgi:hypothetical protein
MSMCGSNTGRTGFTMARRGLIPAGCPPIRVPVQSIHLYNEPANAVAEACPAPLSVRLGTPSTSWTSRA